MALWRKLFLFIPLGVIAFCWMFYYIHRFVFGWVLMAGSAALILALIAIIFIRPLLGGTGIKALRVVGRCMAFLALAAAILFQCVAGVMIFWFAD